MISRMLQKKEIVAMLEIIQSTLSCAAEDQCRNLVLQLRNLIPFDSAVCGLGSIKDSSVSAYNILNISYPSEWLELYVINRYERIDPIVKEHTASFKLQCWADTYKKYTDLKEFINRAEDFDLKAGYTLGFLDSVTKCGSIFTIAGPNMKSSARTELILNFVVPHFHQVLKRIFRTTTAADRVTLSDREKEVLKWLTYGKTSWDISAILKISESTVNYHFGNILYKLDAVNRAQALAIALDRKLIKLE
jgi:DNA-binding CsgD family transcriptional regulator